MLHVYNVVYCKGCGFFPVMIPKYSSAKWIFDMFCVRFFSSFEAIHLMSKTHRAPTSTSFLFLLSSGSCTSKLYMRIEWFHLFALSARYRWIPNSRLLWCHFFVDDEWSGYFFHFSRSMLVWELNSGKQPCRKNNQIKRMKTNWFIYRVFVMKHIFPL